MMRRNLGSCTISVRIVACLLQAAKAVELVDATLLGCDNKEMQKKS